MVCFDFSSVGFNLQDAFLQLAANMKFIRLSWPVIINILPNAVKHYNAVCSGFFYIKNVLAIMNARSLPFLQNSSLFNNLIVFS